MPRAAAASPSSRCVKASMWSPPPPFNISTLKQVWVSAEVFERQAAQIKVGDPVTMTLDYARPPLAGRVDYPTRDARCQYPHPGSACASTTRTSS